jgi:DNA polymerase V
VFIRTNLFNPQQLQYQRPTSINLDIATQDTRVIVATANLLLEEIYKPGCGYHKCGVQLSDIKQESQSGQIELLILLITG